MIAIPLESLLCAMGGNKICQTYLKDKQYIIYTSWQVSDLTKYYETRSKVSDIAHTKEFLKNSTILFEYGNVVYSNEKFKSSNYTYKVEKEDIKHESVLYKFYLQDVYCVSTNMDENFLENKLRQFKCDTVYFGDSFFKSILPSFDGYCPHILNEEIKCRGYVTRLYGWGIFMAVTHYYNQTELNKLIPPTYPTHLYWDNQLVY